MSGIMVVFGTRPEAIKLAPVIHALRRHGCPPRICVTGQHRALLDQVLSQEDIRPDIDLDLMRSGQSVGALTGRILRAMDQVLASERPGRVIVQGDTATALAASQAAFLRGIPVGHVEAGLRTGDLSQPWPEEGIRRAIAAWADLHFAPTVRAAEALRGEGVPERSIHLVGNPIVDAIRVTRARVAPPHPIVRRMLEQSRGRRLVLVTCHRRESLGVGLDGIASAIRRLAERPDVLIVLPIHPNPRVRVPLAAALEGLASVCVIEPLPFEPFLQLLEAAHFVLTDSGGVQEEAPLLGTPVLVARDTTERLEGVDAGTAILVGTSPHRIATQAARLLDNALHHARMARVHSPYGDGHAADRIAAILTAAERQSIPLALAE